MADRVSEPDIVTATARVGAQPPAGSALPGFFRRAIGLLLIALTVLPVWRALERTSSGLAGEDTITFLTYTTGLLWSGAALALIPLVVLLGLGRLDRTSAFLVRAAARVASIRPLPFALGVGAVATLLALLFSFLSLEAKPNLIDSMAQLLHGRYLAAGMLAGSTDLAQFHVVSNTILTGNGWVSQYPPGHPLLLAVGLLVGAVWAVGPLCLGTALCFTTLIAERLLPRHRVATRLFVALAATSPFLIAHAGAYMNHTSAAAFTAASIYAVIRARDGSVAWAAAAGAIASFALLIRPLSALAMIVPAAAVAWTPSLRRADVARALRLVAIAVAAALPLTLAHLAYNAHFFGSPFRLGYIAAYGPSHELGFGTDPWGNRYGFLEALAYTSSDLTLLGVALFETPLPLVAIVGLFLLLARRLDSGERVVLAWALGPVAANFFYWHHGIFMGPRMLNEAAPAWVLLVAVAVSALLARVPRQASRGTRELAPRPALIATLAIAFVACMLFMTPRRLESYGGDWFRSLREEPPAPAAPALVFVHGPWMGRVGSRLVSDGIRLDSLETALRQNTTCTVQRYADARTGVGGEPAPELDLDARADRLLPRMDISPDNFIRFRPDEPLSARCVAEIRADERGVFELAPFLWTGDLPGLGEDGVMYARDLGPAENQLLLRREPHRTPWLFAQPSPEAAPRLMTYDEGMTLLWRAPPSRRPIEP